MKGGKVCVCMWGIDVWFCDSHFSMQPHFATSQLTLGLDSLCVIGFYCLTPHSSHNNIQSQCSRSDNKWRTDKAAFLCLFSLINMFWLAEQSHRQTETCRISGARKWVTVSRIDRKWGLLWGQCIDFLAYQVWECREKSHFLSWRMKCQLSDSQQPHSFNVRGCEIKLELLTSERPFHWTASQNRNERASVL